MEEQDDVVPSSDVGELEAEATTRPGYWSRQWAHHLLQLPRAGSEVDIEAGQEDVEMRDSKEQEEVVKRPSPDPLDLLGDDFLAIARPTPPPTVPPTDARSHDAAPTALASLTQTGDSIVFKPESLASPAVSAAPSASPRPTTADRTDAMVLDAMKMSSPTSSLPSISLAIAGPSRTSPSSPTPSRSHSPSPLPSPAAVPPAATLDDLAVEDTITTTEAEGGGRRTFRKRTAAQLNPYLHDQLVYARRLAANQWQDAIVALPKPKDKDKDRKGEDGGEVGDGTGRKRRERDDLGGWLEFEDRGEGPSGSRTSGSESQSGEEDDLSLDDDDLPQWSQIGDLPPRKPRRRKSPLSLNPRHGRSLTHIERSVDGNGKPNRPRHRPVARFDDIGISSQRPPARPKPSHTRTKPNTVDASLRGITVYGGGGIHLGPLPRPRSRPDRATYGRMDESGSETATPASRRVRGSSEPVSSQSGGGGGAKGSRTGGRRKRKRQASLPNASIPKRRRASLNVIELDGDEDEDDEGDDDEEDRGGRGRTRGRERSWSPTADLGKKLDGKRKKALRAMMPAAFFKRAKADLELMQKEREEGVISGSDRGSGDEDEGSTLGETEEEEGASRMKRARVTRMDRDWNEPPPPRLAHLLNDGPSSSSSEGEEEDEAPDRETQEDGQVSHWLALMGPGKARGRRRSDAIDKYLNRGQKGKRAGPTAQTRDAARPPLKDKPHAVNGGKDASKKSKPKTAGQSKIHEHFDRPISLIDDHALWGTTEASNGVPGLGLMPPALRAQKSTLAHNVADVRSYSAFKDFSHDFRIARLPAHVRFPPFSYTSNGFLRDLVDLGEGRLDQPLDRSCTAFEAHLDSRMAAVDLAEMVSPLADQIQDEVSAWLALDPSRNDGAVKDAETYLRFLGVYASAFDTLSCESGTRCFLDAASETARDLLERLKDLAVDKVNRPDFSKLMLVIAWGVFELAHRLRLHPCVIHGDGPVKPTKLLERATANLIRRLMEWGMDHTMKRLKDLDGGEGEAMTIDDPSAELWACLLNVVLAPNPDIRPDFLRPSGFWKLVLDRVKRHAVQVNLPPVATGEAVSYSCMTLCALSQFGPTGVTGPVPRLPAFWDAMAVSLEPIQVDQLTEQVDATSEWRRDRYLWCLYARCLVFADVWSWPLDFGSGLIAKLYSILNARKLERLSFEQALDFPALLDASPEQADLTMAKNDSIFVLFLKILFRSVRALDMAPQEKERFVARELMKMSPIRQIACARQSRAMTSARTRSGLVNHYSLFIAYILLCPSSAGQQMAKIKNLCKFDGADDEARKVYLGMLLKVCIARHRCGLDLKPAVEMLVGTMQLLRREYGELERAKQQKPPSSNRTVPGAKTTTPAVTEADRAAHRAAMDSISKQMSARALEICAVMRAVQHILRLQCRKSDEQALGPYPDIGLLHRAWTTDLMDSPISLDHLVGSEIVHVLSVFLELRDAALPSRRKPNDQSQDDYGDFDAELYNDPALNALLGGGAGDDPPSAVGPSGDVQERDRAFAELARSSLSGSFYRVLSNLFNSASGASGSAVLIKSKLGFAHQLVDCWVKCAQAVVGHSLKSWDSYVRFGDECWQRIPDAVGRREVGMAFLSRMLELDPDSYQAIGDEVQDFWWEVIVAKDLTIQHVLTAHILAFERSSPVFASTSPDAFATMEQLLAGRLTLLKTIFGNMHRALFVVSRNDVPRSPHAQRIGAMAKAMNECYRSCDAAAKPAYARFCWDVVSALREVAGRTLNEGTVSALRMVSGIAEAGRPAVVA